MPLLGPVGRENAAEVTGIHQAALPEGFLVHLGPAVLRHVYAVAFEAPGAIGLAVREGAVVAGFLLAAADSRALFRHVLWRRGLRLGLAALGAVAQEPAVLGRLLETLRYPGGAKSSASSRPTREAELIAIAIRPDCRGRGYGTTLIEALDREFTRRGVTAYTVSVYADNTAARTFYERLGFEMGGEFEMYRRAWAWYRRRLPGPASGSAQGERLEREG
jgi:ribosomal protein S18 acetylase RimI-like enzyme